MTRVWLWPVGTLVLLILFSCGYAVWFWGEMQVALDQRFEIAGEPVVFEIKRGQTVAGVAEQMVEHGWRSRPIYFVLEARRLNLARRLQAGVYEIKNRDTPRILLQRFVRGEVKIYRVRFIEGVTFKDIRRDLAGQVALQQTLSSLNDSDIMALLGLPEAHPEGQFFPATYDYKAGTKDIEILRRAHRRMQEVLQRHWDSRKPDLPYAIPYEALIMASIIERETARADERDRIAGVFVRRLQRKMKLQADPTVIYGLGEQFDGNLRRIDIEMDTPYNTYTRTGLPPTPIAAPGEAALIAAVNPTDEEDLYFVAKGNGEHEFSATLEGHINAVRRHRLER